MAQRWSLSQEEEDLHRQGLFRKARKGDEHAKQELQGVYGVRLWSEKERATLIYDTPNVVKRRLEKRDPQRYAMHSRIFILALVALMK